MQRSPDHKDLNLQIQWMISDTLKPQFFVFPHDSNTIILVDDACRRQSQQVGENYVIYTIYGSWPNFTYNTSCVCTGSKKKIISRKPPL